MKLIVRTEDVSCLSVDRDGVACHHPKETEQGFYIFLNGLCLHFERESDAIKIAQAILRREGMLQ